MSGDFELANAIHTKIWEEVPEADNPFATRVAYCHGYDVFGEMVGSARWVDMLYLLFRGEAPAPAHAHLLEALAVALANPGPRDPSVHAAMCAGVCGSTAASALVAALSVGAGGLSGSRDVLLALQAWGKCGTDLDAWRALLSAGPESRLDIWPDAEHAPGYDPHGMSTAMVVKQALARFAAMSPGAHLRWLEQNLGTLEQAAGYPLALSGLAAAVLHDLGFSPEQGELLHLLMRLPGAAAHALEQKHYGFRKFPFFEVEVENDPAKEGA
jgi:citrate synthase